MFSRVHWNIQLWDKAQGSLSGERGTGSMGDPVCRSWTWTSQGPELPGAKGGWKKGESPRLSLLGTLTSLKGTGLEL